jgi:hypothetical protein
LAPVAARQAVLLDDLERDLLLRRLYARVLETKFGGRDASRGQGRLDEARTNRVVEFVEAHLKDRRDVGRGEAIAGQSFNLCGPWPVDVVDAGVHRTGASQITEPLMVSGAGRAGLRGRPVARSGAEMMILLISLTCSIGLANREWAGCQVNAGSAIVV